jgi:hypothetical protein
VFRREWEGRRVRALGHRRLRVFLMAATLAALTTLMAAGAASADFWPHATIATPVVSQQ